MVTDFTVIDLDYYGIPEVVLNIRLGDYNDVGSVILHYQNDVVY